MKRDALIGKHCKTCQMFHKPEEKMPTGFCVAHPARAQIIGMAPIGNQALVDPTKPQKVGPMVHAVVPIVSEEDGCWEHRPVLN